MPLPGKSARSEQGQKRTSFGSSTPTKYNGGSHATTSKPSSNPPDPGTVEQVVCVDQCTLTLIGVQVEDLTREFVGTIALPDGVALATGYKTINGRTVERTMFYHKALTVFMDGEDVMTLLHFSRDGNGYSELRVRNHVLYRKGWTDYITRLLRATGGKVNNYTAIDIAVDGHDFLKSVSRAWQESDVKNYGRGQVKAHFDSTCKILTGIDIGAKGGDNRMTIYDKPPDEKKPYINAFHVAHGLDVARKVERCEQKYRAGFFKRVGRPASEDEREAIRAGLQNAKEIIASSKEAVKDFSKGIIARRAREIEQLRTEAAAQVKQVGYRSPEAATIRNAREDAIRAVRERYKAERDVLRSAKQDCKDEATMYIQDVDNALSDLLNGNFDYRQFENPCVLADLHKRGADSLLKIRKGEGRPDRLEKIEIIDYDALGAIDIKLLSVTKKPNAIWGAQRKISFDMREAYVGHDLMNGLRLFEQATKDCHLMARKYGVLDWFAKNLQKWKEDKEYHDAITKATKAATIRNRTFGLNRATYALQRLPNVKPSRAMTPEQVRTNFAQLDKRLTA